MRQSATESGIEKLLKQATSDDPTINRLLQQMKERKEALEELDKQKKKIDKKAQQVAQAVDEYSRLYNEILESHNWSKSTASRKGIKSTLAVIGECRKAAEQAEGSNTRPRRKSRPKEDGQVNGEEQVPDSRPDTFPSSQESVD